MQTQPNDTTTRKQPRSASGIEVRHTRACELKEGGRCTCHPTFRAYVWSRRDRQRIRSRTFLTRAEAGDWLTDANKAAKDGALRPPSRATLREAAAAWLEGAMAGTIRNRSGDRYKPSALRGYEASLENLVLPELGGALLSELRQTDIQDFADRLLAEGRDPSTIRNTVMPLRTIFRRAKARGEVGVNPTTGLELPAVRGKRDRIASPDEAAKLLAALPDEDRALWATAMFAGLRRGELLALRWENVDLAAGVIRVERSWDVKDGPIEPKSAAGRRAVPIPAVLRDHLDEHKLRQGRDSGLVFGRSAERPFNTSTMWARARKAWDDANKMAKAEGRDERLEPIGMHEARHTFASLMIAAGVNSKSLSTYLGHSSIAITLDRYGHLMPGAEDEAAGLLDAYLERANTQARLAQVGGDA